MLTQLRVVKYVNDVRRGQTTEYEDEEPLMLNLVKEYSNFSIPTLAIEGGPKSEDQEVVVRSRSQLPIYQISYVFTATSKQRGYMQNH